MVDPLFLCFFGGGYFICMCIYTHSKHDPVHGWRATDTQGRKQSPRGPQTHIHTHNQTPQHQFCQAKLCDFGLCSPFTPGKPLTDFCGSPGFCAPEMITAGSYDGPAADIWSLGCVCVCVGGCECGIFLPSLSSTTDNKHGPYQNTQTHRCILLELSIGHDLFCDECVRSSSDTHTHRVCFPKSQMHAQSQINTHPHPSAYLYLSMRQQQKHY